MKARAVRRRWEREASLKSTGAQTEMRFPAVMGCGGGPYLRGMVRLAAGGESAALSRELSDFLIAFSIGLHKNAIYPPGHPLLEHTTAELIERLGALLRERASLSLGVARHQLIIEGVATDEGNPVLRELAMRLHRHHLGAVKFLAGVGADELTDMLRTVAVDAGRLPRPLGLEEPEVLSQWPHLRLYPMTFAQLQLLDEDALEAKGDVESPSVTIKSRAASLWVGLARAALVAKADQLDIDDSESMNPSRVAEAIEGNKRDAAYDQVVVGYLLQIAEELKTKSGREALELRRRVSQLVEELSPERLGRLLEMGGDAAQRTRFVRNAAEGMAVDAVMELVRAASQSSGQNVSHSMMRMLSKLAVHAEVGSPGVRTRADGALREQVVQMLDGWSHRDPNPESYRRALEKISTFASAPRTAQHAFPVEPERLLAMGLEIETLGAPIWSAVETMAARDDIAPLLNLLDNAPALWMREVLWRHVATPARLRGMLARDPVPIAVAMRLARRMGAAAASVVLDALEESDAERRVVVLVELLAAIGASAGPVVMTRLAGMRWATLRPLLAMLGKYPEWACGYEPAPWLTHPSAPVRREALRQELRAPATRDAAIVRALTDADESNVRLGLGAAMTNCPRDAAAVLRSRADDPSLSEDLRALGIRALASQPASDTALWLAARVLRTGKLLKREVLAPKSPEMLAALEGLAMHWRDTPAARTALALAAASVDPEISAAAVVTARSSVSMSTPSFTPAVPAEDA